MSRSLTDEYDFYIEELFQAQHGVSEKIISHTLERGQIREGFIKDEIRKRFEGINIKKGFIAGSARQISSQSDILILKKSAQTRKFAEDCVIADVEDVLMLIEVKSSASGSDVKKFCTDVKRIKRQNYGRGLPLFGMFCYRVDLKTETLYSRFGYEYDEENDLLAYAQDPARTALGDYARLSLAYPEIDFFISIHKDEAVGDERILCFRQAADQQGNPYFVALKERPVTQHLWKLIQDGV